MGEKPNSEWARTLGAVDESIARCLESLNRYEAKFDDLLKDPMPGSAPLAGNFDAAAWTEKLAAAEGEVSRAEQLIAEQEASWAQSQAALAAWQISVQRLAPTSR